MSFQLNLPQTKRLRDRLIVHVFHEDESYPRVTHIFNGSSRQEVLEAYKEHRKHDRYLRRARKDGSFNDQPVRLSLKWHKLTPQGWAEQEE